MAWSPVDEGNVKVVTEWGEVKHIDAAGPNYITPVKQNTHKISVRPQIYVMSKTSGEGEKADRDDSIRSLTNDQQVAFIDVGVRWHVDASQAGTFFSKAKTLDNAEATYIRDTVRSQVRTEVGGMMATEVNTKTGQTRMAKNVEEQLNKEVEGTGIVVEAVNIRNVEFSEEYQNAVEQKKVAQQEVQQSKAEAESKRIEAQGDADANVIESEGEAKSTLVKAEAKAEANRKIRASLNDDLIQYEYAKGIQRGDAIYLFGSNGQSGPLLTKEMNETSD